ncbi:hypothetical protein ACOME3_002451 [Neoechinorhynchus agilis]
MNIGLIVNLQKRGEHAYCGVGIDATSGFSYDPEMFKSAGIDVYGYEVTDFGTINSNRSILKIVHRMEECIRDENKKVAVHCHAGLGRTGFIIACYLVYEAQFHQKCKMQHREAIEFVRRKRPGSIQTPIQLKTVEVFSSYIVNGGKLFCCESTQTDGESDEYRLLSQAMHAQSVVLYGATRRSSISHIPLVLYVCVKRLVYLCNLVPLPSSTHRDPGRIHSVEDLRNQIRSDIEFEKEVCRKSPFECNHLYNWLLLEPATECQNPVSVQKVFEMLTSEKVNDDRTHQKIFKYRSMINQNWVEYLKILVTECVDIELLTGLFTSWFNDIDEGVIRPQVYKIMKEEAVGQPETDINKFFTDPATNATVRLVVVFYARLLYTLSQTSELGKDVENLQMLKIVSNHLRLLLTLKRTQLDIENEKNGSDSKVNLISAGYGIRMDESTDELIQYCLQKWIQKV